MRFFIVSERLQQFPKSVWAAYFDTFVRLLRRRLSKSHEAVVLRLSHRFDTVFDQVSPSLESTSTVVDLCRSEILHIASRAFRHVPLQLQLSLLQILNDKADRSKGMQYRLLVSNGLFNQK
ncbi:Oidioi.mRNA.OKI2018_I69.XSR.g14661.t1.cds [Oikopleura dioica]|uniref:Oidioi.mRNA.OKI2018_I69.XSR.g14661.t1.cds n=1 Tax=Oikopleura dioica TaxID=34765 RepID=A0ABN7SAF7_OIKDI|nr:Oidioi.mRNA.OKI2018_I69.XSR.g14661.t1.cds [Oikopleura dioica]